MQGIYYLLILPLLVATLYGLILGGRENQIRAYLSARSTGWLRRRYVKLFIGAVRGEAAAFDTSILAFFIIVFLLFSTMLPFYYARETDRLLRNLQTEINFAKAMLDKDKTPTQETDPKASITEWIDKGSALIKRDERAIVMFKVVASISGICLIAFSLFWYPFLVFRRQFAHELDRFTLRIQGLASKAELAELAVAEAKVKDEETLRLFVDCARAVALRHNIPQLVSTFDLWRGIRTGAGESP